MIHDAEIIGTSIAPRMQVMPSNNSGLVVGYLCGKYPGRLGWLIGPGGWRRPPSWMPVALDNGAFPAWVNKREWDEHAWWELLETATRHCMPKWAVVPDVVADREATLASWAKWEPILQESFPNLPLAIAVQDGMTPDDVPASAKTIFVGGTTEWKWRTATMWTSAFPGRVHIARVNSERLLWMADRAGAVSCDGTGWMRGDPDQLAGLERYLEFSTRASGHPQLIMQSLFQ